MNIANCTRCGKIFRPVGGRKMCPQCLEADQKDFAAVRDYLKENPGAHIAAVSEATGVPVKRIQEYLREGRLVLAASADWLRCERCGAPLQTGRLCAKCLAEIAKEAAPSKPAAASAEGPVRFQGRKKVIRDKFRRW
mgnify:CR=1 FL=1